MFSWCREQGGKSRQDCLTRHFNSAPTFFDYPLPTPLLLKSKPQVPPPALDAGRSTLDSAYPTYRPRRLFESCFMMSWWRVRRPNRPLHATCSGFAKSQMTLHEIADSFFMTHGAGDVGLCRGWASAIQVEASGMHWGKSQCCQPGTEKSHGG